MKKFVVIFWGVVFLFTFQGCDKNRVFEEYRPVSISGWDKDSLIVFNIPVSNTLQYHNLLVNVRNDVNYKYSNLWLFIEINQPDGAKLKDTFELSLADPAGKWLGEGFGGLKTRQVMYRRNVNFPVSGNYTINIQHGMREGNLTGISDIGFRVEKLQ